MQISDMWKFILKVSAFIAVVVLVDICAGPIMSALRSCATGGSTYKNHYIMEKSSDDVIVLGASRAMNHYVPSIIADSLNLSCYNCGESGNGIVGAYARYCSVAERNVPKLVIYECISNYDCYFSDQYAVFLWPFRPYTYKKPVQDIFNAFGDRTEQVKLYSNLYKNNSRVLLYLKDCFVPNDGNNGYSPLEGIMKQPKEIVCESTDSSVIRDVDSLKLRYMGKLFKKIKSDGAILVCVAGPYYMGEYGDSHKPIIDLCEREGIPFYDYRNVPGISDDIRLFKNDGHLNSDGAKAYSRAIIPILRENLSKK